MCEDGSSPVPADGLVDEPDDEAAGGTITLSFASPMKCSSLRAIDVETTEAGDRLELSLSAGGTQVVPFALLGDNSAQTVTVPNPAAIDELKIILVGSGGIDDISCSPACGDGVLDVGEECDDGNGVGGDCCSPACLLESSGSPCDDNDACTANDQCDGSGVCGGTASTCGDGVVEAACGEQCDDGNATSGDCCDSGCQFEPAGSSCPDEGNVCTDDTCDGSGGCTHTNNTAPCDDGSVCTTGDSCSGGSCVGAPISCDDGNICTDDSCDPAQGCVFTNNTAPCNDGDQCTDGDTCNGSGICAPGSPVCSNGIVESACGEQCDDSNNVDGDGCEADCTFTAVCGNGILEQLEECDDGNTMDKDGCSSTCELEDRTCFQGKNATVSNGAKYVTFESTADFLGTNSDGNQEIFVLNRKEFKKQIIKGRTQEEALSLSLEQVTDTAAPISNGWPTLNRNGRFIAFVSNGSLCLSGSALASECSADSDCPGGTCSNNADGNKEVFHLDLKKGEGHQVSNSQLAENLHPNLRAFQGNLLMFDSDANLVPDRCSGGRADLRPCQGDSDCPGGTCGNLEGNREIFEWVRTKRDTDVALRQITTAPIGDSKVGRSLNFFTRATAFSSTAGLLGSNADASQEIFRVKKKPATLVPVTEQVTTSAEPQVVSESPAQSKGKLVAFVSNGELVPGENPDRNPEVFLWKELRKGEVEYTQITHTSACVNAFPSISARGRFIAFQSNCDLIPSKGNPGQSVFIYHVWGKGFLRQIVLRGPNGADSSRPTVSRKVRVITFEADLGPENAVCIFDTRREVLEGPVIP